jgi:hypothetical protein
VVAPMRKPNTRIHRQLLQGSTSTTSEQQSNRATERNRASGTGERRVQAFEEDGAINRARANYHVRIPGDGEK